MNILKYWTEMKHLPLRLYREDELSSFSTWNYTEYVNTHVCLVISFCSEAHKIVTYTHTYIYLIKKRKKHLLRYSVCVADNYFSTWVMVGENLKENLSVDIKKIF